MSADQNELYVICWKNNITDSHGYGEPVSRVAAENSLNTLNTDNPNIEHWISPFIEVEKSKNLKKAFETLKQAMIDDPEQGGYAHSWHCNIAMMCFDAILTNDDEFNHEQAHKIGNDAASRFMRICFDVETKYRG